MCPAEITVGMVRVKVSGAFDCCFRVRSLRTARSFSSIPCIEQTTVVLRAAAVSICCVQVAVLLRAAQM